MGWRTFRSGQCSQRYADHPKFFTARRPLQAQARRRLDDLMERFRKQNRFGLWICEQHFADFERQEEREPEREGIEALRQEHNLAWLDKPPQNILFGHTVLSAE